MATAAESMRVTSVRLATIDSAPTCCVVCGEHVVAGEYPGRPLATVRPSLVDRLRTEGVASISEDGVICNGCLTAVRIRHARAELERERGELTGVEEDIARRAATHTTIADELERGTHASFGQRAADAVARVGGSWRFVLGFLSLLLVWCFVNGLLLTQHPFDRFPFILLNLVLSCLAALQAPIIMMSQARVAEIDRARANQDFRINLKAELEVGTLHEKMDHMLHQQWDRMVELQDLQLEILQQLRRPVTP